MFHVQRRLMRQEPRANAIELFERLVADFQLSATILVLERNREAQGVGQLLFKRQRIRIL